MITNWQLFTTTWSWDPSVIVGCIGLILGYMLIVRLQVDNKAFAFFAGVFFLFIALESPLDTLGDTYLFSAHMVQHLLLLLVVPPLLLIGAPAKPLRALLDKPFYAKIEKFLAKPLVAWFLGVITVWAWHIPVLYNAALASENIHILEHTLFLITGTIFWWPVFSPLDDHRITTLFVIPYLFTAAISNSTLGVILTYAKPGLYPAYIHPVDEIGALSLIRQGWGISPEIDQQLGGLLMWVPGGLVYLLGIMGALMRWYGQPDEELAFPSGNSHSDIPLKNGNPTDEANTVHYKENHLIS
jgi:putative membrane protein